MEVHVNVDVEKFRELSMNRFRYEKLAANGYCRGKNCFEENRPNEVHEGINAGKLGQKAALRCPNRVKATKILFQFALSVKVLNSYWHRDHWTIHSLPASLQCAGVS